MPLTPPRHKRVWEKDFKTDLRKNNFCGLDWTGPHGFQLAHSTRGGFPNQLIFDEMDNNILPARLRNNITQNQRKMECRNVFCTKVKLFLHLITTSWLRIEEWRYSLTLTFNEGERSVLSPGCFAAGDRFPRCLEDWVSRSGPGGEKQNLCLTGNQAPKLRLPNPYLVTILTEARWPIICVLRKIQRKSWAHLAPRVVETYFLWAFTWCVWYSRCWIFGFSFQIISYSVTVLP
jgi:hypothetical protein